MLRKGGTAEGHKAEGPNTSAFSLPHLPHQLLGLFLIKIEKQRRRNNVIQTIVRGRMRLNILVHITNFRLDLWSETISDPDKAAVLIEPQMRLKPWPPVRKIGRAHV